MDFLSVVSTYEAPAYRQPLGFLVPRAFLKSISCAVHSVLQNKCIYLKY